MVRAIPAMSTRIYRPHVNNYFGDLERNFPAALDARATKTTGGHEARREIILFVLDKRHTQWSHNLMLNLDELGIGGRALGIGTSKEACTKLLDRMAPDTVSCGRSSFLRRPGGNATLVNALDKWQIREWHVYHLWWQRWHYVGWAVRMGYNAMSLDTDISIRVDPYSLFHGALAHRQLIFGLDSTDGGSKRPGINGFPMVNVGLVYCQRCTPDGPAHRVLSDVIRRVFMLLDGPLLRKTRNKRTAIAERVLWEQDLFKDSLEHVAFALPSHTSRHSYANANPPEGKTWQDVTYGASGDIAAARQRNWRIEQLKLTPSLPPQDSPWLLLLADSSGDPASATATAVSPESATGLPLWVFSPWNVPPHGMACAGQWASRPSPVMIGHMARAATLTNAHAAPLSSTCLCRQPCCFSHAARRTHWRGLTSRAAF